MNQNDVSNDPETFSCHTWTSQCVCPQESQRDEIDDQKRLFGLVPDFQNNSKYSLYLESRWVSRSWILLCRATIVTTHPEGSNSDTMTPPAPSQQVVGSGHYESRDLGEDIVSYRIS